MKNSNIPSKCKSNCCCLSCMNIKRHLIYLEKYSVKKPVTKILKKTKKDEILEGIKYLKSKKVLSKKDKSNLEILQVVLKTMS